MTKKLFWDNPYQASLTTGIATVDGQWISLKDTIFYAFSGGQERDAGTIAGYEVLDARKNGLDIEYLLDANHSLKPGTSVEVKIDWERRYRLMRLHFAAELILELAYQQLSGIEKIGAHISVDKARLDFIWPQNISTHFPLLLQTARQLIAADRPIISAYSDREKQRRYWEVDGFARVPCGGTHLRRTGEVGDVRLKRKNIGGGKERIEVFLSEGGDASPVIRKD